MKGWADHCSSDEEDHDAHEKVDLHADDDEMKEEHHLQEETPPKEAPPEKPKTYDYPTEPPYTAFIGNLSYNITDPKELAAELTKITKDKLGVDIKIEEPRIMMDRRSEKPRHRGFGYVQVETLDMLKALMQLNDGNTTLAGRKIQLDTANGGGRNDRSQRKSSGSFGADVDGSKFRGGRYANNNRRGSNRRSNGDSSDAPAQRPSLKLQPRTKPVEEKGDSESGSSANIFGGAKPRDEQTWQERRKSEQDRKPSKGGRGDRRVNRGKEGKTSTKDDRRKSETKPVEKKTPAAPPAQPQPEKPAEKKVSNKFAALDFDSDSE